jgi:hypothetical protein
LVLNWLLVHGGRVIKKQNKCHGKVNLQEEEEVGNQRKTQKPKLKQSDFGSPSASINLPGEPYRRLFTAGLNGMMETAMVQQPTAMVQQPQGRNGFCLLASLLACWCTCLNY